MTLADGTKYRIDALSEPTLTADCDPNRSFDVLLGDIERLEFIVEQTGWGSAIAPAPARQPPKRGRSR